MFDAWSYGVLPVCVACGDAIHDEPLACAGCDGDFCDGCVRETEAGRLCVACARPSEAPPAGQPAAASDPGHATARGRAAGGGIGPRPLADMMGPRRAGRPTPMARDDDGSGC